MRSSLRVCAVVLVGLATTVANAQAQSDPPARVGRLAYLQGAVSFHDAQQDTWSSAALNTPLTTGDSLWTEPDGHDEIQIAGSRVRMDGDTQLDMLALDDSQTRLQLDQGRLDIRAFSLDRQPYQIVTPRGTVTLEQPGDYYVHAGSSNDPTVLGVRAGAAQIQTPNGQLLAVRAGEEGQVTGDDDALQLRTIRRMPPPMPAYWAARDRIFTDNPPQYLSADVTGYEDLAAYGSWTVDPNYGEVWYPTAVPVGWQPYTTGYWTYVAPWGWTWVDAQPWGFAPYHYGRWLYRRDRWCWVPPDRDVRPIYAPALVAFIGGTELGISIGLESRAPVGWFPLGPHEPYVPPYASDPDYYRRINAGDRIERATLQERWERAERREAFRAGEEHEEHEVWMNRRFATVVPAADFAHSRSVQQVALRVPADKLAAAPVAPVAAPPAPNRPIAAALQAPANRGTPPNAHPVVTGNLPTARSRLANMETIGRPAPAALPHPAPGPKIVEHTTGPNGRPGLPPLPPHTGAGPQIQGGHPLAATPHPGQPPLPQVNRAEPHPEGQRLGVQHNAAPPPHPEVQHPEPPRVTNTPPHPDVQRVEPQRPSERPRTEPEHPAENRAPIAPPPRPATEPQHPAPPHEPQHPSENRMVPQQPPHHAEAPHVQAPAMPQHIAPPQQQAHVPPPAPRPAPPPPQMHAPSPPPHPSGPPPQQAHAPAPPPHRPAPPHPSGPPQQAQAPAHHEEKK